MKPTIQSLAAMFALALLPTLCPAQVAPQAKTLKLHNIFDSDMVLQRDKPIKIWGWGKPGAQVHVKLGEETASAVVAAAAPVNVDGEEETYAGKGRWEVTFAARPASSEPQLLHVVSDGEDIKLPNIVIGDVWVIYGQSNAAFPLNKTNGRPLAELANRPNLRFYSITTNEQASLQDDLRPEAVTTGGWVVSTPETAAEFSAIGYVFGADIQQALDIPIGMIKNARGGASIESMVPAYKFDEDPLAKRYADHVRARMAAFNPEEEIENIWSRQKARAAGRGEPEPKRPTVDEIPSWNIPGKSPGSMASVYNGMFGSFKGLNLSGVLFHQGHNNQMSSALRPDLYRVLMRLMIEGLREEFNDPLMPVAVIGFNAGGVTQNSENFEKLSIEGGPWIREAQRLGVEDVQGDGITAFLPAYDVQVPGLHPSKKREHGWRTARWALSTVYGSKIVSWGNVISNLLSAEPNGDMMVLKFDKRVKPDDDNRIVEGFSIAGEDGKFYMAHARRAAHEGNYWANGDREIHVWSPLVEKPVAVRYAWANSPMGNLYHDGQQDQPFPSFRTDNWELPINPEPGERALDRNQTNAMGADAEARLEFRRMEEAKRAVQILERLKTLGQ
jgi:sialate O-acetylesterase